jgi:hypothetical protein
MAWPFALREHSFWQPQQAKLRRESISIAKAAMTMV